MENRRSRIRVDSILTAVSSKPTEPAGRIHRLTESDHAMGAHTVHVIFYYDRTPYTTFDVDHIRVSLSEVLSMYPPVTGRVTRDGSTGLEIKCNDAGVRVIRAKVDVGVNEWLRSAGGEEEMDLTVWEDMPEDPATWSPFKIQINEFEGGGMAIGISCSHLQADATSLTLLFKSWTEFHRRQPISHPPSFSPLTDVNAVKSSPSVPTAETLTNNMATATFVFSDAAFTKSLGSAAAGDATPFDVFAALFWTSIAGLDHDQNQKTYSLSICLDLRGSRESPYGFFGNALNFSDLTLGSEEMSFPTVARSIRRHVADIGAARSCPSPSEIYGRGLLTCVNMEHMVNAGDEALMYSAMFEDGIKPIHVSYRIGNLGREGMIMVMPSSELGFGRKVAVTLPEEKMKTLIADQEILRLEPKIILNAGL